MIDTLIIDKKAISIFEMASRAFDKIGCGKRARIRRGGQRKIQ